MTPLILVTGGAGFIGGHLVDALLRMDRPVRVLDDFSFGDRARVDEWSGRVEVVEGDILNPELVERAGHGAMTIVHLAAISSVEMSIDDPGRVHDVNTKGTLHVAQAAASNGAKLIFGSSAAVYGDLAGKPAGEDSKCRPISPYGAQKLLSEHYLRIFERLHGVDAIALRFFNVYGPRQRSGDPYAGVIRTFFDAALRGEPIVVHGDGRQTRDFVFVTDVVNALLLAIDRPTRGIGALNVGTGRSVTIRYLAAAVAAAADVTPSIVHGPNRAGDVRHSACDPSRCRRSLDFVASTSLEDGLRRTARTLFAPTHGQRA